MAVPSPGQQLEGQLDILPLLMEHPDNQNECLEEHVIVISREGTTSSSMPHGNDNGNSDVLNHVDTPPRSTQAPITQSSLTTLNSRNVSSTRRGETHGRRNRSPLNSGLWISVELVVNMSQIIAAVIVLSLSRDEKPQTPLFAWVIGYTAGCILTLPHLYWRYTHRTNQGNEQEPARGQSASSNNHSETSYTTISVTQVPEVETRQDSGSGSQRLNSLVDHTKMALDCFFAVWFVVGNVWIFGGHSSASDAPNLYRLCIVFLTFSCIGYAMPFILCATICCCLPCIVSLLGLREDLNHNKGATTELINTLPTYKFKTKRMRKKEDREIGSDCPGEGGILAAGTNRERVISAEDAVCCICLSKYADNDVLRELPCSHFFHMECVDKWLKINALCPLCKSEVGEITCSNLCG